MIKISDEEISDLGKNMKTLICFSLFISLPLMIQGFTLVDIISSNNLCPCEDEVFCLTTETNFTSGGSDFCVNVNDAGSCLLVTGYAHCGVCIDNGFSYCPGEVHTGGTVIKYPGGICTNVPDFLCINNTSIVNATQGCCPEPCAGGRCQEPKIPICHQPGTNAEKTLLIPQSAMFGHLGHGDTLGACYAEFSDVNERQNLDAAGLGIKGEVNSARAVGIGDGICNIPGIAYLCNKIM